jgi:hypothetical protein
MREEDCEFEASLGYIARSRAAWDKRPYPVFLKKRLS